MAYDIHGPWSDYTDFNSPLYTPSESSPQEQWSCDAAVRLWESCGFPASKIVMGIPFYGYRYSGVSSANSGLYRKFSSAEEMAYDDIVSPHLGGPKRYWHSEAGVPWLYGGSVFISYDDPQSIALKAAFIKQSGLMGAGIWELSQNADGTLLRKIRDNIE
jgi:chitinase